MATTTDFPRSPVPGLVGPGGAQIYRYDDPDLQKYLDGALTTLGSDEAFATVAFEQRKDTGSVIRFSVAKRLGDHISMAGVLEHTEEYNAAALGVRFRAK